MTTAALRLRWWRRDSEWRMGEGGGYRMRGTRQLHRRRSNRSAIAAFTLVEVVISVAIAGLGIGGIVWGYAMASQRTEWTAAASAAQMMALRHLETTRGARWDPRALPPVDELVSANFPERVELLAVPRAGGPGLPATNRITIQDVTTNPPLRLIRVECVWSVLGRGPFTNTVVTYRGAD